MWFSLIVNDVSIAGRPSTSPRRYSMSGSMPSLTGIPGTITEQPMLRFSFIRYVTGSLRINVQKRA